MTDRVTFTCNGNLVDVDVEAGESLLSVLRERLGLVSVKDGCAPQGQCGCCTVLVDGEPRVACVTAGRARRGPRGDDGRRSRPRRRVTRSAAAFVATGGSQCGFCTPGIVMRAAAARRPALDRALAAHLCRCTGWRTVYDALETTAATVGAAGRDLAAASPRAQLEGGVAQRVDPSVPLGGGGVRRRHRAARRARRGTAAARVRRRVGRRAPGLRWVIGESLRSARAPRRARCRAGARRPTRRRRCRCCRCRPAACASRRRGSSPRTSSPTRRGAHPAASRRRRSRTAARSAARRTRRAPDAARELADAPRPHGARRVLARRRRAARTEAAADRRDRGVARRAGRDRRTGGSRRHPRTVWPSAVRAARSTRAGTRSTSSGPPVGVGAARVRPRRAGGARRRRARRRRRRPVDADRRRRAARHARRHAVGRARRRARDVRRHDRATRRMSTSASRPAIRSTRSCCARTRSARRTWRSAGCSPSRSPSIRRPARCTTSRSGRSASSARGTCRRSTSTIVDDPRPAARAVVRRGVRRGRGGRVERAHPRRRRPPRYVPRARHRASRLLRR